MKCLPDRPYVWLAPFLGALAVIGCQENVPNTVPSFGDRTIANQVYTAGEPISPLTLPSASGGEGDLSYSLEPIPAGLAFDAGTRRLSGTPTAASTYSMTYEVEDEDADSDKLTFTITVLAPGPPDTAPSFTGTVQDQRYTVGKTIELLTLPAATGGNGTLTYSLEPVPPGLLFNNPEPVLGLPISEFLRFLAGTPSTAGTYEVEYRVEDADANTADSDADTLSFTIVVDETASPDTAPIFDRAVGDQTYTAGEPIAVLTLPAATGGNGVLTYSLVPSVSGLTFDSQRRTLSGTPAEVGIYSMTYTAVDADENTAAGDAATLTFTITVQEAAPPDTAPMFDRAVGDQTYTAGEPIAVLVLPAATGGNGVLTYSLVPSVSGLTFDSQGLTLSGTPAEVGIYPMTYKVVDADQNAAASDAATLTFTIIVQPDSGPYVELIAALNSRILEFTSGRDIGAAAVGIMKDGEIIYDQAFGWKDKQRTIPLPENVLMRIASITKPVTAAAVHELIADGMLNLDDYVFDVGQPGGGLLEIEPYPSLGDSRLAQVTVQHLLQHRGGWDRDVAGDLTFREIAIAEAMSVPSPPGRENMTRYVLGQPLQFSPGTRSAYSNFGYLVLGLVIERISGRDYMSFVKEKVLAPLGVPAADVIQGRTLPTDRSDREPWYDDGFGGRPSARNVFDPSGPLVPWPDGGWHHEAFIAHGGLVTSTRALLEFLDVHQIAGPNIGQRRRSSGWWYHTGLLTGTNTLALQRDNGVNYAVLFNRRRHHSDEAPDYVEEMRVLIDDLLTAHGVQRSVLPGSEEYGERDTGDVNVHR